MADNRFRFTNEKCPVCNITFKEDDDIAVCPECGTPHHRECYKSNNKCANHEKHGESFRWEPDFVAPEVIETPKPREEKLLNPNPEQIPFFSMQLNDIPNLLNGTYEDFDDGIKSEDVALFVRQDANKYVDKFHKIKNKNTTWNWSAFFFTPYWFFYRKMYKIGSVFLALSLLISITFSMIPSVQKANEESLELLSKYNFETMYELTEEESMQMAEEMMAHMRNNATGIILTYAFPVLLLSLSIIAGLMGNKWYYNYALKNVKKIKTEEKDREKQKLQLLQRGGTSAGGFFLAVLANNMIVMAAEMLMTFIK